MKKLNIFELVTQTREAFVEQGYSEESIHEKNKVWMDILRWHFRTGNGFFNPEALTAFAAKIEMRYSNGWMSRIHYRFLLKSISYLKEYNDTGKIKFGRQTIEPVSKYYDDLLSDILSYSGWKTKDNRGQRAIARKLFIWLKSKGHETLDKLDEAIVKEYLVDCASRLSGASIDTISRTLKSLLLFLYEAGHTASPFEKLFSFGFPYERIIKPATPHSEIAATLGVIDRSTVIGKRDYASILLAVVTGLRAGDISLLTFKDIDWANGEIKINQSKTGKSLALPLTADVGSAMQDYILNGRPSSDLDSVFLRARAPMQAITPASLYGAYNVYRAAAGLGVASFHSLRRTVGTNMVTSDVPVTTVAQVLGHSDIDSTRKYIAIDTKHLKDCALDFCGIAPKTTNQKVVLVND